jgi:DNA repair protein RadD
MSAIILRPDQVEARDAALAALEDGGRRPLIVMPTGSGKSMVIGGLASVLASQRKRVLVLAHRHELIEQNAGALLRIDPLAPVGICHAGSGRDEHHAAIVVASIATIYRRRHKIARFDVVVIDEAHLLSPRDDAMIGKIMQTLAGLAGGTEPPLIGLTATPFRTGLGNLVEAGLFQAVVFERSIATMIEAGQLCPIRTKAPKGGRIDTRGVRVVAGEFKADELAAAAMQADVVEQAVARAVEVGRADSRRSWLFFSTSVEHAHRIEIALTSHGVTAATVTGETPTPERAETVRRFRAGELRALVNCAVFTTGFDAPATDMISVMRPTISPVLWVQMVGRGTRTSPGKVDCILLDFGGNLLRHGPIDNVRLRARGEQDKADAAANRLRICPQCDEINSPKAKACSACGYEWQPVQRPIMIDAVEAQDAALVGNDPSRWRKVGVRELSARLHHKPGSPPSLRVFFHAEDGSAVSDFWALEHPNKWARTRGRERWSALTCCPELGVPVTAADALRRFTGGEIKAPSEIVIERRDQWRAVVDMRA